MNEDIINKRIKKSLIFIATVFSILIIIFIVASISIHHYAKVATHDRIQTVNNEYKNRIFKQIDADFQILDTFASVIEQENLYNDEQFAQLLDESNHENNFLTMAYFNKQETGIIAYLNDDVQNNVPLSSVQKESQDIIHKALTQNKRSYHLYTSDVSSQTVFVYGIPLYHHNQVIGCLLASQSIQIFEDILNENALLNGNGYIHMIDNQGNFIIKAKNAIVQEDIHNIFEKEYFGNKHRQEIQNKLNKLESCSLEFAYKGETYQTLLEPINIDNIYLFSINSIEDSNYSLYLILQIIAVVFIIIFLLVMIVMIYGYNTLNKHNQELVKIAYYDDISNGYTMTYFQKKAQESYQRDGHCSIVAMNIQQFKFINEIFGKETANNLLAYLGRVIEEHLQKDEFYCRQNADLFYIYFKTTDSHKINQIIQEIYAKVTHIHDHYSSHYRIQIYSGVAIAYQPHSSIDKLMNHVMFALASAKKETQNKIWFYDQELHKKEQLINEIETHMHQALQNHEFQIYIQPKIDLKTENISSGEVLVRWIKNDGSTIYPSDFIPLFEQNGFCVHLDLYVFEQACLLIKNWIDQGYTPMPLSINQSKLLFFEANYIEKISYILDQYKIPAHLITLEILEGLAFDNTEEFNNKIQCLHDKGLKVSLDDFGSGYSSLNTLSKLDIDELKIDQGFLKQASLGNQNTKIILEEIINISKRLSISTVIEGVETQDNHQFIQQIGCDYGQGYYYSMPISWQDFHERYIKKKS